MKKLLFLLCCFSLLLTACSAERKIQPAKEELLEYYESHQQALTDLSRALLEIVAQEPNVSSVCVYLDRPELALNFTVGSYEIRSVKDFPRLEELLATAEIEDSPIENIWAYGEGSYFDSPTCEYGFSIMDNGELYYHFELAYTEVPNVQVIGKFFVDQLAPNWQLVHHYWY